MIESQEQRQGILFVKFEICLIQNYLSCWANILNTIQFHLRLIIIPLKNGALASLQMVVLLSKIICESFAKIILFACFAYSQNGGEFSTTTTVAFYYGMGISLTTLHLVLNKVKVTFQHCTIRISLDKSGLQWYCKILLWFWIVRKE